MSVWIVSRKKLRYRLLMQNFLKLMEIVQQIFQTLREKSNKRICKLMIVKIWLRI